MCSYADIDLAQLISDSTTNIIDDTMAERLGWHRKGTNTMSRSISELTSSSFKTVEVSAIPANPSYLDLAKVYEDQFQCYRMVIVKIWLTEVRVCRPN